jgi:hypothetical protein
MPARSAHKVLEDHLRLRAQGKLEEDIRRNYAEDVVLLHVNGVEHGHEGIRKSGHRLGHQLLDARFEYVAKHAFGEYGYLEWRADSEQYRVEDGADSYVIRDGKIVMQTVHYRLLSREEEEK